MKIPNPFEAIIDKLIAIQTQIGDIDTVVRSGNLPPIRKPVKKHKEAKIDSQEARKEGANG